MLHPPRHEQLPSRLLANLGWGAEGKGGEGGWKRVSGEQAALWGPPSLRLWGGVGVGFDPQTVTHIGVGRRGWLSFPTAKQKPGSLGWWWGLWQGVVFRAQALEDAGCAQGAPRRAPGQPSSEPFLRTLHGGSRELERRGCQRPELRFSDPQGRPRLCWGLWRVPGWGGGSTQLPGTLEWFVCINLKP